MSPDNLQLSNKRSPCEGMLRVVQFNWPLYATAAAVVVILLLVAQQPYFAGFLQIVILLIALLVGLQAILSLLASHWVYDRSDLSDWRFLRQISFLSNKPLQIINVHSGYDESSGALNEIFKGADVAVIDLFPALGAREPSIIKARKLYPPKVKSLCETINNWPVAESSVDLVLVAFAAHELRDPEKRLMLFNQVRQVLKPEGRLVLVEHVRDAANFIAFGPGFMHFLPLGEWLRCAAAAHLKVAKQYRITPLVVVLELCL